MRDYYCDMATQMEPEWIRLEKLAALYQMKRLENLNKQMPAEYLAEIKREEAERAAKQPEQKKAQEDNAAT